MNALNPNWASNLPSFDEYITSLQLKRPTIEDTTKKWLPILEEYFSNYNIDSELMSNICLYIELCSSYYDMLESLSQMTLNHKGPKNRLTDVVEKIKNDIDSKINNKRSGVVRKVFNYQTGKMEYELEDGNFITINESVIPPKIEVDNDIFPIEFVKLIDPQKYRDMKIDEIL
jgi:putative alpha-1,2-mannosidase